MKDEQNWHRNSISEKDNLLTDINQKTNPKQIRLA